MEIALYSSGKRSKKFRSSLFKGLWVSKGFAYVGVLTVFETRKGIEKMPVVLTGKSKLHVFPLRRAKGNWETDIHPFSRLKSVPVLVVLRSKTQNIVQKEKVAVSGVL